MHLKPCIDFSTLDYVAASLLPHPPAFLPFFSSETYLKSKRNTHPLIILDYIVVLIYYLACEFRVNVQSGICRGGC